MAKKELRKIGFWHFWTCPKCGAQKSTYRLGKSDGKRISTYCSSHGGMVPIDVERKEIVTRSQPQPAMQLRERPEPGLLRPVPSILLALLSVAIHAEELLSPTGHAIDRVAMKSAMDAPGLREWIAEMTKAGYAPVKR